MSTGVAIDPDEDDALVAPPAVAPGAAIYRELEVALPSAALGRCGANEWRRDPAPVDAVIERGAHVERERGGRARVMIEREPGEHRMASHEWPGNVSGLVNVVSVAATFAEKPHGVDDVLLLARDEQPSRSMQSSQPATARPTSARWRASPAWSATTCRASLCKYGLDKTAG